MPKLIILCVLLLAACSNPRLNAGVSIGTGGVSVVPSVSAGLGGGTITYRP